MNVVGRSKEIEKIKTFIASKKSEFMAVYGRRRVGKTFLINTYFENTKHKIFSASGINKASFESQRHAFCSELSHQCFNGLPISVPKTWFDVFEMLDKAINETTEKFVIFLDELPWMYTPRSQLLQVLEYFWNKRWNPLGRVKLIVCGSLSSWIIRNILEDTEGFYQRVTYRLSVEPLNLGQTKAFLKHQGVSLTNRQILNLYSVMGGIPLYLEQIKKGKSAEQTIDETCFQKEGLLYDEMKELFKSLFKHSESYMEIARELAKYRYGLNANELAKKVNISEGGRFREKLKELEEAGFIISFLPYQHKEKGLYYRILDEYTMFYFSWIEPNLKSIQRLASPKGYWQQKSKEGGFQAWKGYTFESICYKHILQIQKALGLEPTSIPSTWRHVATKKSSEVGAQIDLLFDRSDDAVTICEIKCTHEPFILDKSAAKSLQSKAQVFKEHAASGKQIFLALIAAGGIKPTMYSEELLACVVTLDDLLKLAD